MLNNKSEFFSPNLHSNRMSKTTPAGDDKNCLVENDNAAGEDAYSGTSHSNSLQNHNENLQRENASNEGWPIITTATIDETVNNTGDDGNGSMSANQNETNDTTSVNREQEDNELSNIITETPEDIEHGNTASECIRNVQADEQPVNANVQNYGYVPDDEISDAVPSNASVEVSVVDVPTSGMDRNDKNSNYNNSKDM